MGDAHSALDLLHKRSARLPGEVAVAFDAEDSPIQRLVPERQINAGADETA
jgi:hypothetical protein